MTPGAAGAGVMAFVALPVIESRKAFANPGLQGVLFRVEPKLAQASREIFGPLLFPVSP